MTELPLALSFFDPDRDISGTARAGMTLLFEGKTPTTLGEGPRVDHAPDGAIAARLGERFDLRFEPAAEPARLTGLRTTLCTVTGTVDGAPIDCLGTATETTQPPQWSELDAVRGVTAVFGPDRAVFVLARRPRGAMGHGHELVEAKLVLDGEIADVEDARLSTVYDGDGRQRNAGLELFLPGEDFPRRLSGSVHAGASLSLEGLRVNAAVFDWRMEGREGVGAYELAVRDEQEAA
ncbi:MAG: hypothetical protein QOH76_1035 [Thermoleophilaceae bacterium]|nr:hypothetical protein [Thermoleophilaceae bacterium]